MPTTLERDSSKSRIVEKREKESRQRENPRRVDESDKKEGKGGGNTCRARVGKHARAERTSKDGARGHAPRLERSQTSGQQRATHFAFPVLLFSIFLFSFSIVPGGSLVAGCWLGRERALSLGCLERVFTGAFTALKCGLSR